MTDHGHTEFVRLTQVPLDSVVALLNEPRITRHLPLSGEFSERAAADWVRDKDAQWQSHGYGPWAIVVDGGFAGWGGFQHEPDGADFALVLRPEYWGLGSRITQLALDRGFGELGLDAVTIALPLSRRSDRIVARFGFVPDGEVSHGGVVFRRFRLTRDGWEDRTARSR